MSADTELVEMLAAVVMTAAGAVTCVEPCVPECRRDHSWEKK